MGSDGVVFFPLRIKYSDLSEPINQRNKSNDREDPVHGIGGPPILHFSEKIKRSKEPVNK